MKIPFALLCASILSFSVVSAQEVNAPVNSGEMISKGIKLHDDQDYEGALEFYEKVPRNDTNYVLALYERTHTLYTMKKYDEAIKLARLGLQFKTEYDYNFYITLGNSLDDNEEHDEAIEVFDEGLKRFPNNHMIRFNKAVCLRKQEKTQEAVDELKKVLRSNPLHPGAHLVLGSICVLQGKIVEAMLALNTFILLEPNTERSRSAVGLLDQLTSEKVEVEEDKVTFSESGDDFSELEVLLLNRVAMSKKYKVPLKLSFSIIKQNHLLFSQFKENPEKYKDGFFTKFYVPFYVSILKNNWFEEFSLYQLLTVDDPKVQEMIKKNTADIKKFIDWGTDEYRKLTKRHPVFFDGKTQEMDHWYYRVNFLEAIGNSHPVSQKAIGKWESYNSAGSKSGEMFYLEDGTRDGLWKDYYPDGELLSELTYKNGVVEGFYKSYFKNGKLKINNDVKADKIHGKAREYFLDGTPNAETDYVEGKKQGKSIVYYPIGTVKYDITYLNDEVDGPVTEYYSNGTVKMKGVYKAGKMEGEFLYYWPNGKLQSKYNYVLSESQGPFEIYHDNGQLKQKGELKNGNIVGVFQTWYANGKKDEEHEYDENGKGNGIQKEYDEDGILMYESETRKDIIVNYKCYDKAGKIIKEAKEDKGVLEYVFYYPNGDKKGEGIMKKGKKDGLWKYYDRKGNLESEETFKNGKITENKNYFKNGQLKNFTRYKGDVREGLYEAYYYTGTTYIKGWMNKDEQNGYWYYYYPDGTLEKILYYINGVQYGPQIENAHNNIISMDYDCDIDGKSIKYTYYDTAGVKFEEINFSTTTGEIVTHHLTNKEVKFKGNYKNDLAHGQFSWFFYTGKLSTEGKYYSGQKTGIWKWYTFEGKVETTGKYTDGERDSTWVDYYEDGKIKMKRFYEVGDPVGEWLEYYENGQIWAKKNYLDGERHGESYYYGEDGQLRQLKKFEHGELVSVSYILPSGAMSKEIPVGNDKMTITTYFKNGKKSDVYGVNKAELDGEYLEYHSNGNLREKTNFVMGFQEGVSEIYYTNGKIKSKEPYYNDNLNGICSYYDVNGNLKSELSYINDDLHGICKYYKNGAIVKTRYYYDGVLIIEKNV